MTPYGTQHSGSPRISRRKALGLLGGASATAVLPAASGSASRSRASSLAAVAQPASTIQIPQTGAALPTENVTVRWIDSAQVKRSFFQAFAAAYQQAHPNITVAFEYLPPPELARVVPIGIQSGNAHDIFTIAGSITVPQAVQEGWIAPLDDIIPNFAEWKAAFPPNSFFEGITTFGGKTYTFPLLSGKYALSLLYNVEYMQQAGYDPQEKPLTWDEFRDAARKITEAGQGQYYGFIVGGGQPERLEIIVSELAEIAGAAGGQINWQTGEYNFATDEFAAVIELLLALNSDGSIFPGSFNLNSAEARARMPQRLAGMVIHQSANIPIWSEQDPSFNFDIASQPVPNSGRQLPLGYTADVVSPMAVYAQSPYKAIAGDIFAYLGSEEGQTAFQTVSNGGLPVAFPEANQVETLDPRIQKAFARYEEWTRLRPDPAIRNPDVAQVRLEMQRITPSCGETVQGLFAGQITEVRAAIQDLQDRSEAELERAIAAAQAKGAEVSRDDWVFPNFDPMQGYTEADYQELTG